MIRFTGFTDPGLVRSVNQDAYHIDPRAIFYCGRWHGWTRGEEASRIATQVIQAYFVEHWNSDKPNPALLEALYSRQIKRLQQSQNHPTL